MDQDAPDCQACRVALDGLHAIGVAFCIYAAWRDGTFYSAIFAFCS